MNITPRETHHAEVTEPDVYTTTFAGKLHDVSIELPDHMVELTVDEARRLHAALGRALRGNFSPPVDSAVIEQAEAALSSLYAELLAGIRDQHQPTAAPKGDASAPKEG